uniref:Uncharacterized protein n=1 Tax=Anguilla anguilla TaxID=7936 RepID=A0A0E9XDR4_ANGAN
MSYILDNYLCIVLFLCYLCKELCVNLWECTCFYSLCCHWPGEIIANEIICLSGTFQGEKVK